MQKQQGRSMVEMLGVLAIIAVLSIGGLLGYRRAVNNHHANQILDDANRLAFVVIESNQAFENNAYIDNLEFTQSSIYNMDAFLGAGTEQFGIVVTDVPKGVCEPLINKAAVDYKVRVLPAKTTDDVEEISTLGVVYDTLNTDICTNDMNDIVLYFGDASAQCNEPDDSGYTPCTENSDCCGEYFCAYTNATNSDKLANGNGRCESISLSLPVSTADGAWIRTGNANNVGMNWYSAQNFCKALGRKPATRTDIGCEDVSTGVCDSDIVKSLKQRWNVYGCNWLEGYGEKGWEKDYARLVRFSTKEMTGCGKKDCDCSVLCH